MKKKIIIGIIITLLVAAVIAETVVIVMLNNKKEENKEEIKVTETASPTTKTSPKTNNTAKYNLKDSDKDIVYTFAKKDFSNKDEDTTNYLIYNIPQINIDSSDVDTINNQIKNTFKSVLDLDENSSKSKIQEFVNNGAKYTGCQYSYNVSNDILSLVLECPDLPAFENYLVYNIDLDTGKKLSNEELIKKFDLTVEQFKTKLNKAIKDSYTSEKNKYMKEYITEFEANKNEQEKYAQRQCEKTLEQYKNKNIDEFKLFINDSKHLAIGADVYNYIIPGGETISAVIDLENGNTVKALYNYSF